MASESVDLVVLIDDSDIDLFVQRRFIELSGFAKKVITFRSSREALDQLSGGKMEEPTLIFLDLNMPELDGFAFLELYRQQIKQSKTRIVILTSSSSSFDRDRASEFDTVVGFLSKPLTDRNLGELDLAQILKN